MFDFALDRALKQISDYSCKLVSMNLTQKQSQRVYQFYQCVAYDGSSMKKLDEKIFWNMHFWNLSYSLAHRWESALLVNVDNDSFLA